MAHSGSAGSIRLSTEKTRPPLVYQLTVASTPSAVFDAFFRQPETWLCRSANVDARVGGELRLCWPDGCFAGRFMHCAPPTNPLPQVLAGTGLGAWIAVAQSKCDLEPFLVGS